MECLSGKRPFESAGLGDLLLKIVGAAPPSSYELAPDLPGLREWWVKALARDPRDRFQSARELVDALRPCLPVFEVDGSHGAESARSARVPLPERSVPERRLLELALSESGALSDHAGGSLSARGSTEASPPRSVPARSVPARSVPAHSVPFGAVDSLAAESAPRRPGSVGPISSSRSPQQRRDGRQRTVLIAGGLLAAAVLATLGRLFLAAAPEPDSAAARAPVPPAQNNPTAVRVDPDPSRPSAVEAAAVPPAGVERSPVGPSSPGEPASPGKKPGELATSTQALQPPAGNPPEPRLKPAVATPPVVTPPAVAPRALPPNPTGAANPAGNGALAPTGKLAGSVPKPAEAAVKPVTGVTPPDGTGETEAARKDRLRKATGL
jgi:hypothetical protein